MEESSPYQKVDTKIQDFVEQKPEKIPKKNAVKQRPIDNPGKNDQLKVKSEPRGHELLEDQFAFPDGGWVCSGCQNYNFYGRPKCNRCLKLKTRQDYNGKPKHLLRQN